MASFLSPGPESPAVVSALGRYLTLSLSQPPILHKYICRKWLEGTRDVGREASHKDTCDSIMS